MIRVVLAGLVLGAAVAGCCAGPPSPRLIAGLGDAPLDATGPGADVPTDVAGDAPSVSADGSIDADAGVPFDAPLEDATLSDVDAEDVPSADGPG